ncbi:Lrp/AsnC family transcriptional regulator [Sphingopyxis sp. GW247-27LB]|uniref:Lrp/AsnC family transcriptional regulator n=1 Tax=Sphingopyxis sp. GW247-27LB TaxID=2012632 RepID=UPI000BA5600B|nr:Lrp/AsnC family transcriptional regulator [Sphingopyxis sp. GW247-27LB]PAL22709.1 AsnC family transcriptional regulator [Sphingopyxis sp. GW247-27LB]
MSENLSHLDLRILQQIQRDSSLSTSELSEKVGISQSPCWRRLQRLRDEGYVRKQVALVDRSKFGQSFFIYATLKIGTLTDAQRADFTRKVEITPEILECYSIIGERDVMMKIIAPSMDWYQNFIFKTLMKMPGVVDVQSIIAVAEMKYTTEIPVSGTRAL